MKSRQKTRVDARADTIIDLEPLDTALTRTFGSSYDLDEWTPLLRVAVRSYLLFGTSDTFYAELLPRFKHEVPQGSREAQAEFILANHAPWEVADAAHWAAVESTPDFEQLIQSEVAGSCVCYEDLGYWLDAHATHDQCAAMVRYLSPLHPSVPPRGRSAQFDIVYWLVENKPNLGKLLRAWKGVTDPVKQPVQSAKAAAVPSPDTIRSWAKKHGYVVGDRGRLPREVAVAYQAAVQ